jgi:excinuclease ABC subunit A
MASTTTAKPGARLIRLRGVRVHNLKGIDLDLPLERFVVLSGVSGSGKSSLAFDTLYAEGQRRYVETFSAYTRQFLERLDKPDADLLEGIPPAIAVAQRGSRWSARSTVGTVTEIHDHLALLYARVGKVVCLNDGEEVRPADPQTVSQFVDTLSTGTKYAIAFPFEVRVDSDRQALANALREDGLVRIRVDGEILSLESGPLPIPPGGTLEVLVDRMARGSESAARRLDSIEMAFEKGFSRCLIIAEKVERIFYRGWRCGHCGKNYEEPDPRLFSYNSPLGACASCEGLGRVLSLDRTRIVPDRSKTLRDGAIAPWTSPAYREWNAKLLRVAPRAGIDPDRPFSELGVDQIRLIEDGGHGFPGLRGFFQALEKKSYKLGVRVFLSRWRRFETCPECQGARLRPEALAVKIDGLNITSLSAQTIEQTSILLQRLTELPEQTKTVSRALDPVLARLDYLVRIGLGYLTLDRPARSFSAGEAQRVALTSALGSGLVNTLYILDEPTVGLHPRDVGRLIEAMTGLRDRGNSVVAVEHDPSVVRSADWLVDIGPGAGESGGKVVYAGPPAGIDQNSDSVTGAYLSGRLPTARPPQRRARSDQGIRVRGASGHNLKSIDVDFPLGLLCVVTGVSGAGKSTLVQDTLFPALCQELRGETLPSEPLAGLEGVENLADVALVDQSPIGRSGRSNPITYVKAFDEIRKTFAETHEAKTRNYGPSRFSFNREGGRCNSCEGNGFLTIDMQFLADVIMRCPECQGTRYRRETLEISYRGKNIAEVLDLTVREAFGFFRHRPKIQSRLRPLMDVGLDYLRLGQPSSTLSGGEAQRLKLAGFLSSHSSTAMTRTTRAATLFVFDEPTTGLHPADTIKLLEAFNRLLDLGHSLVIIEHSLEMMLAADWIIDLGPGAGADGGRIVAQGSPEEVATSDSPTGRVLAAALGTSSMG